MKILKSKYGKPYQKPNKWLEHIERLESDKMTLIQQTSVHAQRAFAEEIIGMEEHKE